MLGPMSTYDFKDEAKGEINPSMYFRKKLDLVREYPAGTHATRASPSAWVNLTWWWCARTRKASTPTATSHRAAAKC